jgi:peptide deformylase
MQKAVATYGTPTVILGMTLRIVQTGDPVLRKVARPLSADEIRSLSTQHLIEQMRDTMRAAPGVGLAAPQIGESIQLAVIEDRVDYIKDISSGQLTERQRSPVDFHVIINPKLTIVGKTTADFFEGWLTTNHFWSSRANSVTHRLPAWNTWLPSGPSWQRSS